MRTPARSLTMPVWAAILFAAHILACLHCAAPQSGGQTADAAIAALGWAGGSVIVCHGGDASGDDGAPLRVSPGICPVCATLADAGLAAALLATIFARLFSGRCFPPRGLIAVACARTIRIRAPPLAV